MIPARILGTGMALPERVVTTREIALAIGRDPDATEQRTGIISRRWSEPGARATDLATAALREALARAALEPGALRRVIFVSSSSGDQLVPANANVLLGALGIAGTADGFDLNNACMGSMTALDIAARSVATGLGPVAVVAVEMGSRYIDPSEPRPYLIFGDAAAAVIVGPGRPDEGVLGVALGNHGGLPEDIVVRHPSVTGKMERVQFLRRNEELLAIAIPAMLRAVAGLLERCALRIEDIEWVLPHQPNGAMFDHLLSALGVDRARTAQVVHEIGSVPSVAIPASLHRLLSTRDVRPGHRILFVCVGTGLAHGAMLWRVGA